MLQIKSLEELSALIAEQWKKGVASNAPFSAASYEKELQNGTLYAASPEQALLLVRRRDGYDRLNFYLQPGATLQDYVPERTTVVEIPGRAADAAMQRAKELFAARGFREKVQRQRMSLKTKITGLTPVEGYSIRPAEQSDEDAVLAMLGHYDPVLGCIPTREELRRDMEERNVLVAVADGKVAGFLHALRSGNTMEIRHLVVDPAYRGMGIATHLFAEIDAMYDVKRTSLWVATDNVGAIRIYERLGYACDGWTSTVLRYDVERKD